eukprot:TRINITY_DN6854_c0_g2_i1.p1 TRINITY_DN6854_c0_g2~~TRINITY_DN6854_c0_g2_i1.p1  ORF type:complete len:163 (-),score=47.13 TRINITY_DN6854_c0_g2_i1:241-729(-)
MAALLYVMAEGCCQRCAHVDEKVEELKLKKEWAITPASDEQLILQSYSIPTPARQQSPDHHGNTADKRRNSKTGIWFTVQVEKTEELGKLGVSLEAAKDTADIVVMAVDDDGLLGKWNKSKHGIAIQAGDLIFEVNGKRGDVLKMYDLLKNDSLLDIQVRRP